MKTKLLAGSIFALTTAVVFAYPSLEAHLANSNNGTGHVQGHVIPVDTIPNQAPIVEVVFVLDTTGSMGGLIAAAKNKIWSIASTMASAQPAPQIRMGLVAYRDRGDAYVTKTIDLNDDLDSVYAALMEFQAEGGGDTPESVNQGLYEAVHNVSWSQNPNAYQVVFLVGDAPAHMDYNNDVQFPDIAAAAGRKGIIINTIQCGNDHNTLAQWQQLASLAQGQHFQVDQAGSAVAIATPFDDKIAALSNELDSTRLFYGDKETKAKLASKIKATEKLAATASPQALARRGVFNASKGGSKNLVGSSDLVADIASGLVELESIDEDKLPASVQAMAPSVRQDYVASTEKKRARIAQEIRKLAGERDSYVRSELSKTDAGKDSLDENIFKAVKSQAADKGLAYEDAPKY